MSSRTWKGAAGLACAVALCCGTVLLAGSTRGTEDLAYIPGELELEGCVYPECRRA